MILILFKEKVAPCKGAFEFLIAAGFHHEELEPGSEAFLIMDTLNVEAIEQALNVLFEGKAVAIRLFRDRKV